MWRTSAPTSEQLQPLFLLFRLSRGKPYRFEIGYVVYFPLVCSVHRVCRQSRGDGVGEHPAAELRHFPSGA